MSATISRLLKITGLFCKRALLKRRYSSKETYNFKEPTDGSHPIFVFHSLVGSLKLQVSFAKEPYKRDHILRKRPIIWRHLRIVATHSKATLHPVTYIYMYIYAYLFPLHFHIYIYVYLCIFISPTFPRTRPILPP